MASGKVRCEWPVAAISRDQCYQRVWSGQSSGMEHNARFGTARWSKRAVT